MFLSKGKVYTFPKSLFGVLKTWLKCKIKIVNYFYSIFLILLHTLLNSSYAITQEKQIVLSSFLDFITTIYVIWKWLHNYPEEGTQLHILSRDETLSNFSLSQSFSSFSNLFFWFQMSWENYQLDAQMFNQLLSISTRQNIVEHLIKFIYLVH